MEQDIQEIEWLLKDKYKGEKSDAFFADCKRLALGEPLGYLIGHTPFLDCDIYLDSHPLIPRVETEFWTEKAITEIKSFFNLKPSLGLDLEDEPVRVMDMCAGSGCVGVAVAEHIGKALVDFAEIEDSHLPTIAKNVNRNGIEAERVHIRQSSIFSAFPDTKYNFILANPPYIDSDTNRTDDSVINFEPHLALFGGHKGMELIIQLITESKYHLEPDGQLWFEHEPEQSKEIAVVAASHGFVSSTHKDQYGVERYSVLMLQ